MKKIIYILVCFALIICPFATLQAKPNHYVDLENFDFKATPIISKEGMSKITFTWTTQIKMLNFRVTIYNSSDDSILLDYDALETDLEELKELNLQFYEYEPTEEGEPYSYHLSFVMKTKNVSTIKMLISFNNGIIRYTKSIYVPLGSEIMENPNVQTRNAIYSALFAVFFAIVATLIIIITSQYKSIEDESGD